MSRTRAHPGINRRRSWLALLEAALDQPHPTRALRVAIRAVLARDPAAEEPPSQKLLVPVRRSLAERTLTTLYRIQHGGDR